MQMGDGMACSLAEAAAACGLNKTTILRAIKAGKISGTKDEHGGWFVEPAELHRVYPPADARSDADNGARTDTQHPAQLSDTVALVEVKSRAELAESRLADLKTALDELRSDRDAWREQAQRLAIADQRVRRSWWRRLAG
jgi:hypothetical protein